MPGEKKSYIVDGNTVDVDIADVNDFLQNVPNAVEVKSFIVGKDTVDVELKDVDDFLANVKGAKPLYGELGKPIPEGGVSASSGGQLQSEKLPEIDITTAMKLKKELAGVTTPERIKQVLSKPEYQGLAKYAKEFEGKDSVSAIQKVQDITPKTQRSLSYLTLPEKDFYRNERNAMIQGANQTAKALKDAEQTYNANKQVIEVSQQLLAEYEQTGDPTKIIQSLNSIGVPADESNWQEAAQRTILTASDQMEMSRQSIEQNFKTYEQAARLAETFDRPVVAYNNDEIRKSGLPLSEYVVNYDNIVKAKEADKRQQEEAKAQSSFDYTIQSLKRSITQPFKDFLGAVQYQDDQWATYVLGSKELSDALNDNYKRQLEIIELNMPNVDEKRMSKDYFGSLNPADWNWYKIGGDVASVSGSMIPIMGVSLVTGGLGGSAMAGASLTGGAMVYGDLFNSGIKAGMSDQEAAAYAAFLSTGIGALEGVSSLPLKRFFTGEAGKNIAKKYAKELIGSTSLKDYAKIAAKATYEGAKKIGGETATEVAQEGLEGGSKMYFNEQGFDFQDAPKTVGELAERMGDVAKSTSIGLGFLSPAGTFATSRSANRQLRKNSIFNHIVEYKNDPEIFNNKLEYLNSLVQSGKLDQATFDAEAKQIQNISNVVESYPEINDAEKLTDISELYSEKIDLQEKDKLREEKGLPKSNEARIKQIDAEIVSIANAPQEAVEVTEQPAEQQTTLEQEKNRQEFIKKQREQRDKEVEEIQKMRQDLGTDAELIDMLPESVDKLIDRMDAGIPSDNVQIEEAISSLDKTFDELQAYKNNPKRTHTIAQIDAVIDILSETKSEIQQYQNINTGYETDQRKGSTDTSGKPTTTTAKSTQGQTIVEQPTTQPAGEVAVNTQTDEIIRNEKGRQEGRQEGMLNQTAEKTPPVGDQPMADVGGEITPDVSEGDATTGSDYNTIEEQEKIINLTAKALEGEVAKGLRFNANFNLPLEQTQTPKQVSEAYHKAKADGSNPELVKAVEELLTQNTNKKTKETSTEKRMLEGVLDGGTKEEGRKESPQLRTEEEKVKPTKTDTNAKKQQSGSLRTESKQDQAKGASDSNLSKVNKTELPNRDADKEKSVKSKIQENKDALLKAIEERNKINKNIGVINDVRKKAEADIKVFDAFVDLVKEYISSGVNKLSDIAKDLFPKGTTQENRDILKDAYDVANGKPTPERYNPTNAFLRTLQSAYKLGESATKAAFSQMTDDLKSDFKEFLKFIDEKAKEATKDKLKQQALKFNAYKKGQRVFTKVVTDMLKNAEQKKFITAAQYRQLIRRVGIANTPKQWKKVFDLTQRILTDAAFNKRLSDIESAQKKALKVKHSQNADLVKKFTRINPEDISEANIAEYLLALEDLALNIPRYARMNALYDKIENDNRNANPDLFSDVLESSGYNSSTLKEAYDAAEEAFNKVMEIFNQPDLTIDDYVYAVKEANRARRELAKIYKRAEKIMQQAPTEQNKADFADFEKGYDDLLGQLGRNNRELDKKFPAQVEMLKDEQSQDVMAKINQVNTASLTEEEKALFKKIQAYSKSDLKKIGPIQLDFLAELLDNFNAEGYFDIQRFKAVQSAIYAETNKDKVVNELKGVKAFQERIVDLAKASKRLKEQYAGSWQGALTGLNNITAGAFDKVFISPLLKAFQNADTYVREQRIEVDKLLKKHGLQPKLTDIKDKEYQKRMRKIGMIGLYLREFGLSLNEKPSADSNIGKRDIFENLGEKESSEYRSSYRKNEIYKMEQEIYKSLPKGENGKVDPADVYDSIFVNKDDKYLSKNEREFLMDAYALMDKNRKMQQAANAMRGKPFKVFDFYVPIKRYAKPSDNVATPFTIRNNSTISYQASSGEEVNINVTGATNNNIVDMLLENAEETARDYYMTNVFMDINAASKAIMQDLPEDKKEYLVAMMEHINNSSNDNFSQRQNKLAIYDAITNYAVAGIFLDALRTIAEVSSFAFSSPLLMGSGIKTYGQISKSIGSDSQISKLMQSTESIFSGQLMSKDIDVREGRLEKESSIKKLSKDFASAAERVMKKPLWYANFAKEFMNITGKEFDIDKYNNDLGYRRENREAIEDSRVYADKRFMLVAGVTTKGGGRTKVIIAPGVSVDVDSLTGKVAGLLSGYSFRVAELIIRAYRDIQKGRRAEGLATLASISTGALVSQLVYSYQKELFNIALSMKFGDDDEEKEAKKKLEDMNSFDDVKWESISTVAGIIGSRYSGLGRTAVRAIATIAYSSTGTPEEKERIYKFYRKVQYGKLTDYSGLSDTRLKAAILNDLTATNGFIGVNALINQVQKTMDAYQSAEDLYDAYKNGTPKQKEEAQDYIALLYLASQAINVVGAAATLSNKGFAFNNRILKKYTEDLLRDITPSRALAEELAKEDLTDDEKLAYTEVVSKIIQSDNSELDKIFAEINKNTSNDKTKLFEQEYIIGKKKLIKKIDKYFMTSVLEKLSTESDNEVFTKYKRSSDEAKKSEDVKKELDNTIERMINRASTKEEKQLLIYLLNKNDIIRSSDRWLNKVGSTTYYNSISGDDGATIKKRIKEFKGYLKRKQTNIKNN